MPISNGNTVDAAEINARFTERRATMDTRAAVRRQWEVNHWVAGARVGSERLRSVVFTPDDDCRLVAMHLAADGVAAAVITGTLEVVGDEDENRALLEKTISHSFTTAGTAWEANAKSFNTVTGDVVHLLAGVRYRFELTTSTGAPNIGGVLVLESGWRRA